MTAKRRRTDFLIDLSTADITTDYQAGDSLETLARRYRVDRSTIRRRLLSAGVELRTRAEGIRLANAAGRPAPVHPGGCPDRCQTPQKHARCPSTGYCCACWGG